MSTPPPPYAAPQQPPTAAAPGPGYASPIPVRRAHLGDALASEWTKIRSVRSTMWTLGVMIVLMLGIGLASAAVVASSDTTTLDGNEVLGLGFFGVLLGTICVITLGVLTIASEYGTGMIRTTMTACSSRSRVLAAKAIVFFGLVFVLTTVVAAVVGALQVSIVGGESPSGSMWFKSTVGVGLFVALIGLLGLAVGTLVRHSAGAVTIMIGLVLLPLVLAIFMFAESLKDLQQALLEYSIPSQIAVLYDNSVAGGSGPSGWDPLWIMLVVTGLALGGAFATLNSRDV
ncbi:ABC transporter permease [Streptomyces sp. VRA16 Mangrove soil]|uniref:ABC transporter permease n=1 Tax=Streptomyces sp. VRA16 Mangrove soil TaxID=2817434 RepID=UPI001A9CF424|nr:ABC transporter permease [Streptomyces sp. VRA16 Mangrove soil]MBO1336237.1 ABC transporter permease subunit [Streptomyces sp. VRA16 Mangrove soil]